MKKKSIGVLGSGSWATALVKILSENTSNINWYIRNSDVIEQIKTDKKNPKYLSYVDLFYGASLTVLDYIDELSFFEFRNVS